MTSFECGQFSPSTLAVKLAKQIWMPHTSKGAPFSESRKLRRYSKSSLLVRDSTPKHAGKVLLVKSDADSLLSVSRSQRLRLSR